MNVAPRPAALAAVVIALLATLLPLFSVFDGAGWFVRLASAVVLAALIAAAIETFQPRRELPLLSGATLAGAVLWTLIVIRGGSFASNPLSTSVWSSVFNGFLDGWGQLLDAGQTSADLAAAETLLGFLLWASTSVSVYLVARYRSPLALLISCAALLVVGAAAALPTDGGDIIIGAMVGAAALVAVAAAARTEADAWGFRRVGGLVATVGVAGLIGAGVVAITDPLQRDPVDPRSSRDTTVQTIEVPDLLSEFGGRSAEAGVVFTVDRVTGDPDEPLRFRLQTYGEHDGRRFIPRADYVDVTRLDQGIEQLIGLQYVVSVRLSGLDAPFIPVLDRMIQTDVANIGWDASTETAARLEQPTAYQVTGTALSPDDVGELPIDSTGVDEVYLALPEGLPSVFRTAAREAIDGAANDREAVEAIVDLVSGLGRDGTAPSGHSLGRLEADLTNGQAGTPEQLATIQTLLLRSAGIPARPVVGYVATDSAVPASALDVWVEVPFAGIGWAPTQSASSALEPPPPATEDQAAPTTTAVPQGDVAAQAQPRELGPSTDLLEPEGDGPFLSLGELGIVLAVLLVIVVFALVAARISRRRQRRRAFTYDAQTLGAWSELIDRLHEAGYRPRPAMSVNDVVELAADVDLQARPAAESLGRRAAEVFHGPWGADEDDAAEAWADLVEIERHFKERQGRRFAFRRRFDPRVFWFPSPTPPPHRDGGRRTVYVDVD